MSSTNLATLMKFKEKISSQHLLEQFGFLTQLKAHLDYLTVQGDSFITQHNNKQSTGLIVSIEPDARDKILRNNKNLVAVAADQMRFWMTNGKNFIPKFSKEIGKSFDLEMMDQLKNQVDTSNINLNKTTPAAPPTCKKWG